MTLVSPNYLDHDSRTVWERLAPSLEARGVLTEWDVDLFAVFCTAVVHHRRAVELVNQTNVLTKAAGANHIVKNPALQVVRDQAAILAVLAGRYGLTPLDRAALTIPQESDDEDAGAFLALVRAPMGDTSKPEKANVRARGGGDRKGARDAADAVAGDGRKRGAGTG